MQEKILIVGGQKLDLVASKIGALGFKTEITGDLNETCQLINELKEKEVKVFDSNGMAYWKSVDNRSKRRSKKRHKRYK